MGETPDFSEEKRLWRKGYRVVIGVDEVGRGAFAGPVTAAAVCFKEDSKGGSRSLLHCLLVKLLSGRLSFLPLTNLGCFYSLIKEWLLGRKCLLDPEQSLLELRLRKIGVNDSKVLRARKRERLAKEIKKLALAYAVTSVSVGVINRIGIGKATERAARSAVGKIKNQILKSKITNQNAKINEEINEEIFVLSDAFHLIKCLRGLGLTHQKPIKKGDKKSLSIAAASILAKVHRDRLMKKLSRRFPKYAWAKNKGYGTREHEKAILRYGLTRWHRQDFVKAFLEK